MSKRLITIFLLTLITIVAFVTFQLFNFMTKSTIPEPTQKQLEPLDPQLDKSVIEDLDKSLK